MKKKNFNRAVSVALAGLILVNPISAFAAEDDTTRGTQQGIAGGEGYLPVIEDDYFDIIIPTSGTKDRMLDFAVDPNHRMSKGDYELEKEVVDPSKEWVKIKGSALYEPVKRPAVSDDYDPEASIYFERTDYKNIPMGRSTTNPKKSAAESFGPIVNTAKEMPDGATKTFVYSDTSNWIAITNRSSVPVTVKLKAEWVQTNGVRIADKRGDLTRKDDDTPAIYMAVEMTEGYSIPLIKKDGTKNTGAIGENREEDGKWMLLDEKYRGEQSFAVVQTFYNQIKTANQYYKLGNDDDKKFISYLHDDLSGNENKKVQPYYLVQNSNGKTLLYDNKSETGTADKKFTPYDIQKDKDGNSIASYPTFGFRLVGAANNTSKWSEITEQPALRLTWKIEKGSGELNSHTPYFKENEKVGMIYDIDGEISSNHTIDVVYGTGTYKHGEIESVIWNMDGVDYNLLELGQSEFEEVDPDKVTKIYYVTTDKVRDKDGKVVEGEERIRISSIALMNWMEHGYLDNEEEGKGIELKIYFKEYDSPLTLKIVDGNSNYKGE